MKMNSTNRQILSPGLWIVATPIGNLEDLTPRAKWALESADLILCEDTRRTSALFSALQIPCSIQKLHRFDMHQEFHQADRWIEVLRTGKSIALVTDAGTPSVSDPGSVLVAQAHRADIRITPVPGVSAVSTLLSVSGFADTAFTFRGFFPRKASEQKTELETAARSEVSSIFLWFESPHRILDTLNLIDQNYSNSNITVGKELTKLHEKIFHGSSSEVFRLIQAEISAQGEVGEWCFAIQFPRPEKVNITLDLNSQQNEGWVKALRCLIGAQISPSEAAKRVSQEFGTPKRAVYELALQISGKKNSEGG